MTSDKYLRIADAHGLVRSAGLYADVDEAVFVISQLQRECPAPYTVVDGEGRQVFFVESRWA